MLLGCILQMGKISTTSLWLTHQAGESVEEEKYWNMSVIKDGKPCWCYSPHLLLSTNIPASITQTTKMLVESSELPISPPGVCIVASYLLCCLLCWEQVGTAKGSRIQQCHGRNGWLPVHHYAPAIFSVLSVECAQQYMPSGSVQQLSAGTALPAWNQVLTCSPPPTTEALCQQSLLGYKSYGPAARTLLSWSWGVLSRFLRQEQKALCPIQTSFSS